MITASQVQQLSDIARRLRCECFQPDLSDEFRMEECDACKLRAIARAARGEPEPESVLL